MIIAAAILGHQATGAAQAIWRDAAKHPSPNSGISEAGVAGALGIQLGGLNYYGGIASQRATMGMPLQEKWLRWAAPRLKVNVVLCVGALFDYLAGRVPRGPRWLTSNGFEWLWRLVVEPRRLWRRYLIGNPRFLMNVLRQKFGH